MARSINAQPFWERLPLAEMSTSQWESLCDGCGKCCLHKLEDEDTGELHFTTIACRQLDQESCRCHVYPERLKHVPDCISLSADTLDSLAFMPATCAYRLLYEGKKLPDWHPLVSGSQNSVHLAHVSVRGKVISEDEVDPEDFDLYIIDSL